MGSVPVLVWDSFFFILFGEGRYCSCGYSLELSQGGPSREYPQQMFFWRA